METLSPNRWYYCGVFCENNGCGAFFPVLELTGTKDSVEIPASGWSFRFVCEACGTEGTCTPQNFKFVESERATVPYRAPKN